MGWGATIPLRATSAANRTATYRSPGTTKRVRWAALSLGRNANVSRTTSSPGACKLGKAAARGTTQVTHTTEFNIPAISRATNSTRKGTLEKTGTCFEAAGLV